MAGHSNRINTVCIYSIIPVKFYLLRAVGASGGGGGALLSPVLFGGEKFLIK